MAKDWEKLAGEKGEKVSSNRLQRMMRLGSMGAGVAASSFAGKVKSLFGGESSDEQLEKVYRKNAAKMAEVLGSLKGASMKVGQILSADPEILPDEFAEGLTVLQRSAPPMTWTTVKEQIETALDMPMETVFARFDPDPIGSASIGQVHRAKLTSGEEVAVKIQYPGVADSLDSDLETLRQMLGFGRPFVAKEKLETYFTEIREALVNESNYTQEAEQLERFADYFEDREGYHVPRPFHEFTRPTVLVMEFAEGEKLDEAIGEMEEEERNDYLLRFVEVYVWMFHELTELHADPHPGNFLVAPDGQMVLLDFGCVRSFDADFADAVLETIDTTWENDPERALRLYAKHNWGSGHFDPMTIDPEVIQAYHEIILEPFLRDEPFDFGDWQPALTGKKYMLKHPSMLKLTPPPESLLYFRVLSGIKGLLAKMDAKINVYPLALETSRRRGVLTE